MDFSNFNFIVHISGTDLNNIFIFLTDYTIKSWRKKQKNYSSCFKSSTEKLSHLSYYIIILNDRSLAWV